MQASRSTNRCSAANDKTELLKTYAGWIRKGVHSDSMELANRRISSLPEFPVELFSLRSLSLNENQIASLPSSPGKVGSTGGAQLVQEPIALSAGIYLVSAGASPSEPRRQSSDEASPQSWEIDEVAHTGSRSQCLDFRARQPGGSSSLALTAFYACITIGCARCPNLWEA